MSNTMEQTMQEMIDHFKNDQELADCWHDNIAMCAQDSGASYDEGNEAATRFMRAAFKVDTVKPADRV